MDLREGTESPTDRSVLAGGSDQQGSSARETEAHRGVSARAGARRGLVGTRSTARTSPAVTASIRAARPMLGPRVRNRSLRTASGETPPMRSAIAASETPSRRIQSFSETIGSALASAGVAPADLPPVRLAEALAILTVDLVGVLPILDRDAVLERLANRLDEHGRRPGGSDAAAMLGAVGRALIRLGA